MKTRVAALLLMLSACWEGATAAESSDKLLIQGGYVMTMDPLVGDLERSDVLVEGGRIVAVGRDLPPGNARIVDARGQIVLPGFVDAHSHLYVTTMRGQFRNQDGQFFPVSSRLAAQMTPADTYTAMYLGAVELLTGGVTTTGDFFDNVLSPAHGEEGLRALNDAGIRATLYYGGPDKTTRNLIDLDHLQTLVKQQGTEHRVRMGLAWRLPRNRDDVKNWAMRQQEYDTARRLQIPIQVHVSGEAHPMFDALIKRNFLYPGLTVVHATDAQPEQLRALDKSGGSLVLTPLSEQRVGYGLTRLDHFDGVSRLGLGIDGNALAGSADMFANMRLAALTWSGGSRDEKGPAPRSLLRLATLGGAEALGLADEVGSIRKGKRADLQIIARDAINLAGFGGGDPSALLVYSARPDNVRTVIVDGRVLKRDGQLQRVDLPDLLHRAEASATQLRHRANNP
ncbi:amidohydrolase family protein [Pseudomonas kurunegalensis]|uniref:amidohydrolase family protein n=1 Tax=Pseudomonas kurunegalensis TaxID=485880 RepID=UPI002571045F|nr:amidohydrolase family protein [Pseudomonas kurunegalensis]WJD60690.1 amidohydrolase family protein [Pseudomonas kurunegalensis]